MKKITNKMNYCTGCHACYNACPKQCISMKLDKEGFLYPVIDETKCVHCGRCSNICPINKINIKNKKGIAYACISANDEVRLNSSSGGVFSLIAEYILENDGVVFGAAFDSEYKVNHICIHNNDNLFRLRGSKYVQSRIGDTYGQVENYLKEEKMVLFTGTPCQISGLKSYLGREYENLYLQDIVCHGVPSPMVWGKYIEYLCDEYESNPDAEAFPSFREKSTGWKQYSISMSFINNSKYQATIDEDLFMKAFLNDMCLRASCYNCRYKSVERESDITLADFWGVEKVLPEFFDDKGTSLVLINSVKGQKLFDCVKDATKYQITNIDIARKFNPSLYKVAKRPAYRKKFMKSIQKERFDKAVELYVKKSMIEKTLDNTIKQLRKIKSRLK